MYSNTAKQKIKELTERRIELAGSQNKYARSLNVSPAVLSYLINGQWKNLSDQMWRLLAEGCEFRDEDWQLVPTQSYKMMMQLLEDAQEYANTFALIGSAGSGKTTITRHYASLHPTVYRVECAEYFNKKSFLTELLRAMGVSVSHNKTVYEMMAQVQDELLRVDRPLLILDEADKLKDEVIYFFITLYNKLEDKCGLLMCSTEYLRTRIEKGSAQYKKGYNEMYSRVGRRFVEFPMVSNHDIALICQANGVTEPKKIEAIIKDSSVDLRRVKRLVHAEKRRLAKEARKEELVA